MSRVMFSLLCVVFLLMGCVYHPREMAVAAQTKRACVQTCEQRASSCRVQCEEDACGFCAEHVSQAANVAYTQYRHERCIQGKTMVRRLQSYRDPLACKKISCDCSADYRVCVEACSGNIHKRLQVASICC